MLPVKPVCPLPLTDCDNVPPVSCNVPLLVMVLVIARLSADTINLPPELIVKFFCVALALSLLLSLLTVIVPLVPLMAVFTVLLPFKFKLALLFSVMLLAIIELLISNRLPLVTVEPLPPLKVRLFKLKLAPLPILKPVLPFKLRVL